MLCFFLSILFCRPLLCPTLVSQLLPNGWWLWCQRPTSGSFSHAQEQNPLSHPPLQVIYMSYFYLPLFRHWSHTSVCTHFVAESVHLYIMMAGKVRSILTVLSWTPFGWNCHPNWLSNISISCAWNLGPVQIFILIQDLEVNFTMSGHLTPSFSKFHLTKTGNYTICVVVNNSFAVLNLIFCINSYWTRSIISGFNLFYSKAILLI